MRKGAYLIVLSGAWLVTCYAPGPAYGWPWWADELFGEPRQMPPYPPGRPKDRGGDVRDGGPRPQIHPTVPPIVAFPYDFPAKSIVIDAGGRKLYYALGDGSAYEYPIAVGREGFNWTGVETISRKQAWPDWYPPAEMRERDRSLPEKMTGGIKNPLGAIALYLGDTLYRIHGTNDAKSIGSAGSSGCFRMLNSAAMHLASITEIGTSVTVVASLPERQEVSRAQDPMPQGAEAPMPALPAAPPTQTGIPR